MSRRNWVFAFLSLFLNTTMAYYDIGIWPASHAFISGMTLAVILMKLGEVTLRRIMR